MKCSRGISVRHGICNDTDRVAISMSRTKSLQKHREGKWEGESEKEGGERRVQHLDRGHVVAKDEPAVLKTLTEVYAFIND
jgi:hypothetical protein